MKSRELKKGVLESGDGSSRAAGESRDLEGPPVDLSRQVYLTSDEGAAYLRFPSRDAFMQWVYRHGLPKCHAGRKVLFFRKDLDAAVQPLKNVRHMREAG